MSLEDASQKRKERLALLSATKRKREDDEPDAVVTKKPQDASSSSMQFRNYDPESNAPKLGFLENPAADADTVENRALELTKAVDDSIRALEAERDVLLDVSQIQGKKSNWDLKQALERRMEPLRKRQEVIVNRIVRQRLLAAKTAKTAKGAC